MRDVIKEYLVALQFENDEPSLARFRRSLDLAERSVSGATFGMAKKIVEVQGAIVGAFVGISSAAIGMMDKVAMADQGYRLMGLHMMMTTESARKLDMVTKALGADLPTILWDRELHERANAMSADIDRMGVALGPEFEKRMLGIRNIRFEFSRLELATKFLGMGFASELFAKLIPGEAGDKIHQWVDWFIDNAPKIGARIANYVVPVLRETWHILLDLKDIAKEGALVFTNLIGILFHDDAIESGVFSFEKMARAIGHVVEMVEKLMHAMLDAEQVVASSAAAMSALFGGKGDQAGKHFSEAGSHLNAGSTIALGIGGAWLGAKILRGITGLTGLLGIGGAAGAGSASAAASGAGGIAAIGNLIPAVVAIVAAAWGAKKLTGLAIDSMQRQSWWADWQKWKKENLPSWLISGAHGLGTFMGAFPNKSEAPAITPEEKMQIPGPIPASASGALAKSDLVDAIKETATRYQVPPALALAVAQHESGIRENAVSNKGAVGVMQLMPETAKGLGVDPRDALQNIDGGIRYLAQLLQRFGGDESRALAAYNWGPERKALRNAGPLDYSKLPEETRNYPPAVLALRQQWERALAESSAPMLMAAGRDRWPDDAARYRYPDSIPSRPTTIQSKLTVDIGGVYITQPGASADEITNKVIARLDDRFSRDRQMNMTQFAPAY